MKNKILAILLACLMIVSIVPVTVFAADECPAVHTKATCGEGNYTKVTDVAPLCGSYGYTVYQCNKCNKFFSDDFNGEHLNKTHKYKVTTPEEGGTCTGEGVAKVETCENCGHKIVGTKPGKVDHDYSKTVKKQGCGAGTEIEVIVCKYCGAEKPGQAAATHEYSKAPIAYTAPTCETVGSATYECVKCKGTKTVVIEKLNHTQTVVYVEGKEPTCTVGGYANISCSICNIKKENVAVPALGHKFNDGKAEIRVEPTCVLPGYVFKACTVCTELNESEFLDPTGHCEYKDGANKSEVAATCTTAGKQTWTCTKCNEVQTKTLNPTGHTEVEVVVEGTCGYLGYTYTYCTNDNCTGNKAVIAIGGTYTFEGNDYSVPAKKTVDKKEVAIATNLVNFVLNGKEAANYHPLVNKLVIVPGTCEVAEQSFQYCACQQVKETVIAAKPSHVKATEKPFEEKAATCSAKGFKKWNCANCSEIIVEELAIVATAHTYAYHSEYTAATCTTDRVDLYVCSGCANVDVRTIANTKLGHQTPAGYTWEDEKGCDPAHKDSKAGKKPAYKCARCGTDVAEEIIPVDHEWVSGAKQEYKKCVQDGWDAVKTCSDCGAVEYTGFKAAHNWKTHMSYLAPTCMQKGHEKKVECLDCHTFQDGKKGEEIAALGHQLTTVDFRSADCEKYGYVHVMCTRNGGCDYTGTKTVNQEWVNSFVPALGHSYPDGGKYTKVEATCTTAGREYRVCSVCNKEDVKAGSVVNALGHVNAKNETIVDKCTDTVTDRACTRCKTTIAKSHDIKTTTVPSTCISYGYVLKVCANTNCTFVENKAIETLAPHTWAEKITKGEGNDKKDYVAGEDGWCIIAEPKFEGTNLKAGSKERLCTVCKKNEVVVLDYAFEYDVTVDNAAVSGAGYTDSALVAVKVNLNSVIAAKAGVLRFEMKFDNTRFKFEKAEFDANTNFSMFALANANDVEAAGEVPAHGLVSVAAFGKNMNDVEIDGTEKFVVLYFRVINPSCDAANFEMVTVETRTIKGDNIPTKAVSVGIAADKFSAFMDADENGSVDMFDALVAYSITMNFADKKDYKVFDANGKAYDVVLDVNKNGTIDFTDFWAIYNNVNKTKGYDYDTLVGRPKPVEEDKNKTETEST